MLLTLQAQGRARAFIRLSELSPATQQVKTLKATSDLKHHAAKRSAQHTFCGRVHASLLDDLVIM